MKKIFLFLVLLSPLYIPLSIAQLAPEETQVLFQVQQLLEYPQILQEWNNWTNFCNLPPSTSLTIICSGNHITEITVVGNETYGQTLSQNFSMDSFFNVLTNLSNLRVLSLVSLGLWGPLPNNMNFSESLEILNVSSNSIYGNIPSSVTTFKNFKNLVLANNLFSGSVPDLKSLQVLEELDLGNNNLGPEFPSFGNNLVNVILKNNSLRSEIPSDFENFDRLQKLDLSSNELVGPVPSFLFSLQSIQFLSLAKNQLSGALPTNVSCNENLAFVDISNNLLIGNLPPCIGSDSSNRTVISTWNCLSNSNPKHQHTYSFCHKEALAVKPPAMDQKKHNTMKLGIVLGIIAATVGIFVAIGILISVIFRRSDATKTRQHNGGNFVFDQNPGRGSPLVDGRHRIQTMRRMATFGLPPYQNFTFDEIEDATNKFDASNFVAEDSQGQIYKAWLREGSIVLVKCLKLRHKYSTQTLKQHKEMISKLRHQNLVSVLGQCSGTYIDYPSNTSCTFIALEYITKGSLKDHLADRRKKEVLKWPQRMAISMGIAKGIQFLHREMSPGIFGNNLKLENILLDENLTPKISSYNIPLPSKAAPESPLNRQDTPNRSLRLSPLYSSENTEKDDIYEFGVILLHIITGKSFNTATEIAEMKLRLEMDLTTETLPEASPRMREAADPSLRGTFAYGSLRTVAQITMHCLDEDHSRRPSIEDVLWHMQYSIQVQDGWTSSGNLDSKA